MSSEIPSGWKRTRLGDVCLGKGEYGANVSRREFVPTLPRYVRITDISSDGRLIPESLASISVEDANGYMLSLGDLLFARSGATVGKTFLYDPIYGPCAYAGYLIRFRPDPQRLDPYFAQLAVQSSNYWSWVETMNRAQAQPNINAKEYASFSIILPPLDEQRRIAEVLRSMDETITAQSCVCRQLDVTFHSLTEACFTANDGQEDRGWPLLPLGELCESIQVGIVIRPASYYVRSGGIPALRSLNVAENHLDLDDLIYISVEGHRLNSKSSLRAGDVVTRRTGEPGKTALIPEQFPNGLNCIDIIFSRPKAILRSEFLSFFMNSNAAKRQVTVLQGGLAQQHLNVGEMKKLKVPVPTLEAQDEVVATLTAVWEGLESENALLRRLSSLRSAIMSELLSGLVRVPT